jgi:hypothetical protein
LTQPGPIAGLGHERHGDVYILKQIRVSFRFKIIAASSSPAFFDSGCIRGIQSH